MVILRTRLVPVAILAADIEAVVDIVLDEVNVNIAGIRLKGTLASPTDALK